jgi:hypothetical protein
MMPALDRQTRRFGADSMKRPSPALTMLIFFWTVYGVVAAIALSRALPPLQWELLLLLGGIGAALVVASLVLLWRGPSGALADERVRPTLRADAQRPEPSSRH